MKNNNYKIDFEEKFKDDNIIEDESLVLERNKDNSILSLLIYILLFFLGGAALFVGLFFKQPTNDFLVLEAFKLYNNDNIVAYMLKENYDDEKDNFSLDNYVYEFEDFDYILISKNKDKDFLNKNYKFIINGDINTWDNDGNDKLLVLLGSNFKNIESIKENTNINLIEVSAGYSMGQNGIIMFLAYLLVAIPLIYINITKLKFDFSRLIHNSEKPFLGNLVYSFATMFAVSIGLGLLTNIFIQIFNFKSSSANQESIVLMLRSKSFILIAITTVLIGPLVEELIFRKSIFGLIKNNKIAIIVSGLSFGLIHIITELLGLIGQMNFYSFLEVIVTSIPYVGMGFAFSYLYVKNNKNVFLLYIVHALLNLFSVITILFQ